MNRWWDKYHLQAEIGFCILALIALAAIVDPALVVALGIVLAIAVVVYRILFHREPMVETQSLVEEHPDRPEGVMRPHWGPDVLGTLTHLPFRTLVAEYFRDKGYHPKFLPENSSSLVDIYLFRDRSAPRPLGVIQCQPGIRSKVDTERVRQLTAVMKAERVPMGVIVTAGEFQVDAREYSRKHRLKLMTGAELGSLLEGLAPSVQSEIFQRIQEELREIPVCPHCGSGMHRMDLVSQGRHHFWACNNYPDCRATLETG